MSTAEIKSILHKIIVETDDLNRLKQMLNFFSFTNEQLQEHDWWDDLSEQQKKLIQLGLKQAEQGQLIPHEQVKAKFDKWLNDKKA